LRAAGYQKRTVERWPGPRPWARASSRISGDRARS